MIQRSLLVIALLLGFAVQSHAMTRIDQQTTAPDRVGRVDWGLGVAASSNDANMDDGAFYSTALSYGVHPNVALGVEAGWQEEDGAYNEESIGMALILGDIIARVPTVHDNLVPYGVLGLGYGHVYVTDEEGAAAGVPTLNADDIDDGGFAWKLGGGIDWFLDANWILNLEFAYWDTSADLYGSSIGNDPDFWTVGAGVKFAF
jgi:opacity protein-like surface antigen